MKDDLENIKHSMMKEVKANTKVAIAEAVDPLKSDLHDLKLKVGGDIEAVRQTSKQLNKVLEQVETQISNIEKRKQDETLEHRVKDIEKAMSMIKASPVPGNKGETTAIVGFQGAPSADAAKGWLKGIMAKTNIEGVVDIYDKCKGKDFNGMVFVRFSSVEKCDVAIKTFNATNSSFEESRTFMNRDLPVQQRAKFSFLLNFTKLLIS